MNIEKVDFVPLSRLTSQQIYDITCLECCEYYKAPATAPCGHTLCHNCWLGRKYCPYCKAPAVRAQTKLNEPLQKLTEHVRSLGKKIEKLYNIKLDEYVLEPENDPTKFVKGWQASTQKKISVPAQTSDLTSQKFKQNSKQLQKSLSKTQVYVTTRKTENPERVAPLSTLQDDWDKIETMEETEVVNKNKENIKGPMDIEPFYKDDNEYTAMNPRRLKKRLLTDKDANFSTNNSVLVKERVAPLSTLQDDWDKIETMEETEVVNKNKENIKGPMDIETFYIDDNEYTAMNPRRLKKRLLTDKDANFSTNNSVLVKERVAPVSTLQDDWDKIETKEETEIVNKNKENIIGPMDIEPFYIDDNEYTAINPRRLKKRLLTDKDANFSTNNSVLVKEIPKDAISDIDKKLNKIKQYLNHVKKMGKE